ncbi:transposase [Rhizobium rhizogenes]|jgi:transposase
MHHAMHDDGEYQRLELITGRRKRRTWSDDEKIEILVASNEAGANISEVTRHFGVSRGLLGIWRKSAGLTATGSRPHSIGSMRRLRPIDYAVSPVRSFACWRCYEHVGESRTSSL